MSDEQHDQLIFEGHIQRYTVELDPKVILRFRQAIQQATDIIQQRVLFDDGSSIDLIKPRGESIVETLLTPERLQSLRADIQARGWRAYQDGRDDALPDVQPAALSYIEEIVPFDSESFAAAAECLNRAAQAHDAEPPKPDEKTQARARAREDISKKRRELYGRKGKPA